MVGAEAPGREGVCGQRPGWSRAVGACALGTRGALGAVVRVGAGDHVGDSSSRKLMTLVGRVA